MANHGRSVPWTLCGRPGEKRVADYMARPSRTPNVARYCFARSQREPNDNRTRANDSYRLSKNIQAETKHTFTLDRVVSKK